MSEVGNLLARSRAEHANYQRANRKGDRTAEKSAIQAALTLREQAHTLDPDHQDENWVEDRVSHESYIDFYSLWLQEQATTH